MVHWSTRPGIMFRHHTLYIRTRIVRKAHELGVLDGATTNPSLMAKENIRGTENCNRHYVEICNIVEGDVSAEVIATDFEGMVREGEVLAALHPPHRRETALHGSRNTGREIFCRQGYPDELHAGILHRAGVVGGKGRSNLCFSVRGTSRRHLRRRRGISSPHREGLPHLWLQNAGAGRFDPSYAAYYPVSRCGGRCGDMPPCSDRRTAQTSPDGQRAGEVPRRLCAPECLTSRRPR